MLKGVPQIWSEEDFVVSKIENVPWTYAINNLNGKKITESFYEKELQKTSEKQFRIEKVIKKKGDKFYVKWKGYDNSYNSWINKKDLKQKWVNTSLNHLIHILVTENWSNLIKLTKIDLSNYATENRH